MLYILMPLYNRKRTKRTISLIAHRTVARRRSRQTGEEEMYHTAQKWWYCQAWQIERCVCGRWYWFVLARPPLPFLPLLPALSLDLLYKDQVCVVSSVSPMMTSLCPFLAKILQRWSFSYRVARYKPKFSYLMTPIWVSFPNNHLTIIVMDTPP